ncbi:MAG: transglycosylase SLT domain-containing protein [Oligoflexales bacterium]
MVAAPCYKRLALGLILGVNLSSCAMQTAQQVPITGPVSLEPPPAPAAAEEIAINPAEPVFEEENTYPNKSDADEDTKETNKTSENNEITYTLSHMPVEINDDVKRWIKVFTEQERAMFEEYLRRGEPYKKTITDVLQEQGLPTDLYYLALIESGFKNTATSHANAAGMWQFMKPTGKRYGLQVDRYADERRDPIRATRAAAQYLNDLHNVFQSWYLAMAAYNAGEMRIMTAIMNGNSRDFWTLVKNKKLPKETMNYIPKFLAAVIVGHNPEHYGFTNYQNNKVLPEMELVQVPSPISLSTVAKVVGMPANVIIGSNPHLRTQRTPANVRTYDIWVPKNSLDLFADKEAELGRYRGAYRASEAIAETSQHRVRRGENLAYIAGKYKLTIAQLKALNGLRTSKIYVGQKLKVTGRPTSSTSLAVKDYLRYKVQRGDNLHTLSKRFNMPIHHIKKVNRLQRNTIYVGQVLKVKNAG